MHPIIERLREAPPRCIAKFGSTFSDFEKKPSNDYGWAAFDLKCRGCESVRFTLEALAVRWGEPPKDHEIGVDSTCAGCGQRVHILDSLTHGYDGELGHLDFMNGPRFRKSLESFDGSAAELRTYFIFNATIADLDQTSEETGKRAQDLFDAFNLAVRQPGDTEWTDVWVCECA